MSERQHRIKSEVADLDSTQKLAIKLVTNSENFRNWSIFVRELLKQEYRQHHLSEETPIGTQYT